MRLKFLGRYGFEMFLEMPRNDHRTFFFKKQTAILCTLYDQEVKQPVKQAGLRTPASICFGTKLQKRENLFWALLHTGQKAVLYFQMISSLHIHESLMR